MKKIAHLVLLAVLLAGPAQGQSLNVDFGDPGNGPPPTYGAAGLAGVWNAFPALHLDEVDNLLGLDGEPTAVSLRQIGGMENLLVHDEAITGDDATLMDDFLVTYNDTLESCIFFSNVQPGIYEVLVYARMPDPAIFSYTDVDEEVDNPHSTVGGVWPGQHEELKSYSRHVATVGSNGFLNLHSGIVPGADEEDGAALNGVQLIFSGVFMDGFESGDGSAWGP
jgi:hypothetical protein